MLNISSILLQGTLFVCGIPLWFTVNHLQKVSYVCGWITSIITKNSQQTYSMYYIYLILNDFWPMNTYTRNWHDWVGREYLGVQYNFTNQDYNSTFEWLNEFWNDKIIYFLLRYFVHSWSFRRHCDQCFTGFYEVFGMRCITLLIGCH